MCERTPRPMGTKYEGELDSEYRDIPNFRGKYQIFVRINSASFLMLSSSRL